MSRMLSWWLVPVCLGVVSPTIRILSCLRVTPSNHPYPWESLNYPGAGVVSVVASGSPEAACNKLVMVCKHDVARGLDNLPCGIKQLPMVDGSATDFPASKVVMAAEHNVAWGDIKCTFLIYLIYLISDSLDASFVERLEIINFSGVY